MSKFNAAFWKWFGDSKVVDAKGQPLVVYHGTKAKEFFVFDTSKAKRQDIGFHFGSNEAAWLVAGSKGRVVAVYLRLKNPIRLDDSFDNTISAVRDALWQLAKKGIISETQKESSYAKALRPWNEDKSIGTRRGWQIVQKYIEGAGFDGIVYHNEIEGLGDSYIVFHSTQIKSIDNRGTWDGDDPDIRSNPPTIRELQLGLKRAGVAGDREAAAALNAEIKRLRGGR